MKLSVDLFEEYWQAITVIEAQEQLKNISSIMFPKISKSSREKQHKQLHRDAYPASFNKTKQVSNADLAKILSGGG